MKKNIIGKNIKSAQIFIILLNVICFFFLLFNSPTVIALSGTCFFLIGLFHYMKLYSLSFENDYFIVENLFFKKEISKKNCIGIRKISNLPYVIGIEFKGYKEFRFQLGSNAGFRNLIPLGRKSAEDELFEEIQSLIDLPSKNDFPESFNGNSDNK